ncbi:cytidine deaminase [Candidatus Symbiopectobacterium sp. NZEC127]|uniref:cytidine deaminase n=1 Tax=Candidatus Symbiopectobacterium sp. NZEC127 TaxID=2820472 RepID=UPI00222663E9|nr:cytidine deaminase [Candidatus Symbiopectobacterium sp. NZEC127]MCW2484469.1 cytidine deaminase [Candidatus Symbiopectobacterium sp. NZEC127]
MHPRYHAPFAQLSDTLQHALLPLLERPDFAGMLLADDVTTLCTQCGLTPETLAYALLPLAAACAVAPISHFQVGAVAQGESGNLYFGANMEFSAVPLQQTLHAEQSAIAHAWLRQERGLTSITVNYTPCGHCRQFMNELNRANTLHIHLPGREPARLHHYLPDAFGPQDLNITTLLMDPVNHGRTLLDADLLAQTALDAANRSHAPYSNALSGVALETDRGTVYTGRYAENAAFNPSLPPLQVALNLMNLAGEDIHSVRRAALVEPRNTAISQWVMLQIILAEAGCTDVQQHFID